MAIVTIVFGVLLLALGVTGFEWKTLAADPDVVGWIIYPLIFGVAMIVSGFVARSKNVKLRDILVYVNAGIGIVGLLLSALMALNGYGSARSEGMDVDNVLLYFRLSMSLILLIYTNVSVRAVLNLRAVRKAAAEQD
ncbi:MAG: hypothetical protein P4K83_07120 [Terracidiphilus sp.]|nr:hypothetical protein [Terracidiphilus sp.]